MIRFLKFLFNDAGPNIRGRIAAMYALLAVFNLGAWAWAFIAFHGQPVLLGTAFLAYSFGLRHAVDADHIAAIDNSTRKLMQEGQRPVTVGFMFSLGHSTIVIAATAAIAATAMTLQHRFEAFHEIGGVIGTLVSAVFLFVIAAINLIVLKSVVATFMRVRRGERYDEEDLNLLLANRGLLARIFKPMFRLITRGWHMYPLGVLFGLGFDTASEIGLLSVSATQASHGVPIWSIMVFPALFTAGMSLIDATDSILMLGAYGWAFMKPIRKLYYNMTITLVSAVVAIGVGGVEALGLIADKLHLSGAFWDEIGAIGDNFGMVGYAIIGLCAFIWLASTLVYKWRRFDEVEV
ncbi:HoxN/HupN/NixA family nickel/cobalt transporter [Paraburkholderia sp. Ac-20336]|uniref:HoxN/HupN/NixA family nickel/cobalt transporter n=1 Tax=Burkholderiaceae TaxID=119060 RepID=UPI001422F2FE|nr:MULTISPECIES: HoxN/HupN/NixA family nickel/cobalt transporter [Burkholderiaceae]MBN3802654.1 HoxN/HupN/NixA family nickel/cobalt transporter [Paraburkholderia sp. Ac-20336]MBN3846670.1 HoxN/HupN/NixA family nickel/cobalt transporter [Paraburkholderia sp. Ac-20342]NIF51904.1 HoxN/HupN/NixA family nickel/cobalt transporter [Burkholderia sp. Ax-1724]NIF78436.1 HoxN/HupN/NixA family nickel/cobalt transporter [Paraburkholderia sp. Cy-641]